tara:strand:- start:841 stop:2925 length:2085 start_codon:yes stop_codon:yes gene_type:complete
MAISKLITNSLADNAITSDKIENGAVNNAKINASANIAITKTVLAGTQPTISGLSISQKDPSSASNVVISGTNFESIPTVQFLNTTTGARITSATVTYTSAGSITAVFPASQTIGIYKVIVENPTGLGAISTATLINSAAPNWVTNASLGSVTEGETVNIQLLAYDDDSSAVSSYSLVSGSLPSGVTLSGDSSVGALTGTAPTVSADTAHNFTIRATDNESQTTDKAFSLTVADYGIDNSLRFNDDDSASLNITQSAGNRDTWTFSAWIKRGNLGTNQVIIISGSGASDYFVLNFNSADKISWHQYNGSNYDVLETSDAEFRDPSAWYHIVLKVDTTDSTADNRVILYVNGSVASHTANTTFDQNEDTDFNNNGNTLDIGNDAQFNIGYAAFDGYMAEVHLIDGTAKAATDFGETNSNGVWIPKPYTGTYGTNGFYLQFLQTGTSQNSSGIGADTSGNNNHCAVTNLAATDQTTDSPLLNYATMNPLDNYYAGATFSEGNCKIVTGSSPTTFVTSTLGVETGKWYWEVKIIDKAGGSDDTSIGVQGGVSPGATDQMGYNTAGVQLRSNGNKHTNGSNATYMAAQDNNDIIMVAFDKTNNNVYFGANGQWGDGSGNTDESNPTSAIGITITAGDFVFAALGDMDGSDTCTYEINFGNPSFAISSSNSDANGYGSFEYAVPSGYYALNSKNLATYG